MTTAATRTVETIDPATALPLARYPEHGHAEVSDALDRAVAAFGIWRGRSVETRAAALRPLAAALRERKAELAQLAVREMGKPLTEAEAEVEKCATGCDHYAAHAPRYLADEDAPSNATRSYVAFRPLGVLLAIMPWNFPFWQLFRAAAPALAAGNVVVLKHAANVTGCALAIERTFAAAGLEAGLMQTLVVPGSEMARVVADPRIAAVTLTGSDAAGRAVAATAGKHLKKTVLELGGSDAFVVLADADVDAAARVAVRARFQNNGQSCIAAKRFIVEEPVYDEFLATFVRETERLVIGDPMERATTLGPVARGDLRDDLERQVRATLDAGAHLATGGARVDRPGYYYEPTIVGDVAPGMAMFDEETFGPAAAIVRARDGEHAIELANRSPYGLGGNLWSRDVERAQTLAARIETGAVFINGMTASDPRLPFGGVKQSGYGRELGSYGIREFVNVQTIWVGPNRDAGASTPAE